jgi:hypothetical protein
VRLHVSLFLSAWVLMRKIEKILALLRTGGVRALARTLFRRLVFKRWRSVVFVDDMSADHPPVEWPAGYKYQLYPKTTDLTSDEHSALEAMNASGFVAELGAADGLYVVWYGREVASYGAIMCGTRQHSVLGLNLRAPLVGLCGLYVVSCGTGAGFGGLRGRRCQGRTQSGRSPGAAEPFTSLPARLRFLRAEEGSLPPSAWRTIAAFPLAASSS